MAAVSACGSPVETERATVTVTTERSVFEVDAETGAAAVTFKIVNRGSETVFVPRCGDRVVTIVDRREGDEWRTHNSTACPAVLDMSSLSLGPGETARSERPVTEVGRYRLRVPVHGRPDGRAEETITSSSFRVK